jgi:hypothetical protein
MYAHLSLTDYYKNWNQINHYTVSLKNRKYYFDIRANNYCEYTSECSELNLFLVS